MRSSSARCGPLPDGRVDVRFALVDTVRSVQLAGMTYTVTPAQFRATAHKIADIIYEKLTGDAGVFSTRIAYITKQGSALRADRRRRRRRQPAGGGRVERAAALAGVVARRLAARLRVAREQEARRLRAVALDGRAAGARELPRQQQRAGVVARRPPARGHAVEGRWLAALPDQRRRDRRHAAAHLARHRHRGRRSRRTAARSCSRPTAAARRRSTGSRSPPTASSASRSKATGTCRRGPRRTARASCS